MNRHLIIRLECPLMSFGGETIDAYGPTRYFPARSMLAGLIANSLGLRRTDGNQIQDIEDNLVFAARIDREGAGNIPLTDFQTADINRADQGWTTHGKPETRSGGSYQKLILYREYLADACVTVALRLQPETKGHRDLDSLAAALLKPERPLYIGRKPCLPTARLFRGFCVADTTLGAILKWPVDNWKRPKMRTLWQPGEEAEGITPHHTYMLADRRNWLTRLHGGSRLVHEAHVPTAKFRSKEDEYETLHPEEKASQ